MKFDFIIGNPPYQDESVGEQKQFAPPIYDRFMDETYKICDKVELIHPARFLFNAGSTSKSWNSKMLSDENFTILYYEPDASIIFPNTEIKGGIVVSYHDKTKNFGCIGTFTVFDELNSILKKVTKNKFFKSISEIVITRTAYRLTDKMHTDHPEAIAQLSDGHAYDMSTNIFDRLPQIFHSDKPKDGHKYIQIFGKTENIRVYKYIRADYVNEVKNLYKYKISLPKANGAGKYGEVLAQPVILEPGTGTTETFLSIGLFENISEAKNALLYLKSKFARAMLGILKATQDLTPEKFKHVPLQDFTPNSDIDWSKPISEIDQQLYKKYNLNKSEIDFIETHVKEME